MSSAVESNDTPSDGIDRSSTVTVINSSSVTLPVLKYTNEHGSYAATPQDVAAGSANTFKLNDNFGKHSRRSGKAVVQH